MLPVGCQSLRAQRTIRVESGSSRRRSHTAEETDRENPGLQRGRPCTRHGGADPGGGASLADQAGAHGHRVRAGRPGRHDRPHRRAKTLRDPRPAGGDRQPRRRRRQSRRRIRREIRTRRLHRAGHHLRLRGQCHAGAERRLRCRARVDSGRRGGQTGQPDLRASGRGGEKPGRVACAGENHQALFRFAGQRHHAAPDGGKPVQPDGPARHDGDSLSRRRPGDHRGGGRRAAGRRRRAVDAAALRQVRPPARARRFKRGTGRRLARCADLRRGRLSRRHRRDLDRHVRADRHPGRGGAASE